MFNKINVLQQASYKLQLDLLATRHLQLATFSFKLHNFALF